MDIRRALRARGIEGKPSWSANLNRLFNFRGGAFCGVWTVGKRGGEAQLSGHWTRFDYMTHIPVPAIM
jgi:hypothetical protein